jgi:hypothetical protein
MSIPRIVSPTKFGILISNQDSMFESLFLCVCALLFSIVRNQSGTQGMNRSIIKARMSDIDLQSFTLRCSIHWLSSTSQPTSSWTTTSRPKSSRSRSSCVPDMFPMSPKMSTSCRSILMIPITTLGIVQNPSFPLILLTPRRKAT